jgi:hypothetical protein
MGQQIISYLYPNNILAQISDDATVITRDRTVYAKNIKLYQGVTNTLRVVFRNSDQKPVTVTQQNPTFIILRDSQASIYASKPITVTDPIRGVGTVTITAGELLDLAPGLYGYSITVTDSLGRTTPAYVDDNYGARGTLEVLSGAYPEFAESQIATLQQGLDVTNSLNAQPQQNQNSALHTLSLYFSDFTGTVIVQGTQDLVPGTDPAANYFDILAREYNNQNSPDYVNFYGVFQAIRLKVVTDSGVFEQALYRS